MTHNDQKIKEISNKIQYEYGVGGLSGGLYDFSSAVAKEYAEYILQQAIETIQNMPIETVGNSAKAVEQVIKELNKLKE